LSSTDIHRAEGSAQRRLAYRQRRAVDGQRLARGVSQETGASMPVATAGDGCMVAVSLEER
jgi:hypothetical protein